MSGQLRHRTDSAFPGWTEEVTADVVRRYKAGESPSAIARSYGATRNQITAKLHRIGEIRHKGTPSPVLVGGKALSAPAVKQDRRGAANRAVAATRLVARPKLIPAGNNTVILCPPSAPPRAEPRTAAFAPLPGSTPRDWSTRKFSECSWPVTDEAGEMLSCCLPVFKRGWCTRHFVLGTVPAKERQQRDLQVRRTAMRCA